MGYKVRALKGISWVGLFRVSTRIVSLAKTALLARILSPSQFGVYGIALLVLSFLETITETGINVVLVQEKEDIENHIDSAWIVSIARGIIISLFLMILAPFIADFFNTPNSRTLIYLISLVPFLRGFINPAIVKLQKELRFGLEFWYRFSIFMLDALVAVTMSFVMRSSIGVIFGLIAGVILELFLSHIIVKPSPRIFFDKYYLNKILHSGKWITISGIFSYLYQNVDDIIVGKILGIVSLGFYQISYTLSAIPTTEVSDVFSRVTFPVYAKISEDRIRLKRAFLKTTLAIFVLSFPICLIFFLFPKEIILLILGDRWTDAWPVFKVLSVLGFIRAMNSSALSLFLSIGKQKYITIISFVSISVLSLLIFPLVNHFGLTGAAYAALFSSVCSIPVALFLLKKALY